MTQDERLDYLLRTLLAEQPGRYTGMKLPCGVADRRHLLRALFNLRPPIPADKTFLCIQDRYLQEDLRLRGITRLPAPGAYRNGFFLWRGDITTLAADGIVNAANSGLIGCFYPCHGCIDNAIHTRAGVQLRLACAELMRRQRREETAGKAKITPALNLPSSFVLYTVGPAVRGQPTARERWPLASCYRACLDLAVQSCLRSIAFCCISTGEYHFPGEQAAQIAVNAVRNHSAVKNDEIKVIFNVFSSRDEALYKNLLGTA